MNIVDIFREKYSGGLVYIDFIRKKLHQLSRFEDSSSMIVNNRDADVLNFSTAWFGNDENGHCYNEENDITMQLFDSKDVTIIRLSAQGEFKSDEFFVVDIAHEINDNYSTLFIAALNTSNEFWMEDFEILKKGLTGCRINQEYLNRYKSLEIISVDFLPSIEDIENSFDEL